MENKTRNKRIFPLIALLIIGILLAISIIFHTALYKELDKLMLIPRNETYTELYFNDYHSLPKIAFEKERGTFEFTIHNVEGVDTVYPYIVFFQNKSGQRRIFSKHTVSIKANDTLIIKVPYSFAKNETAGSIVVQLTNLNQQIDFILPSNIK